MININEVIETNKMIDKEEIKKVSDTIEIWMCVRLLLVSAFWIVLIRI